MALTPAQQAALKADVLANSAEFGALPQNTDGAYAIAVAYNLSAAPAFTVWKTSVPITQVGQAFVGSEWSGMTATNHTRLQTVAQYCSTVNPSLIGIRAMFDDIWSGAGGTQTRAALLALWKRTATRAEKLLATGTGSDASPATMTFEGSLGYAEVQQAMGW